MRRYIDKIKKKLRKYKKKCFSKIRNYKKKKSKKLEKRYLLENSYQLAKLKGIHKDKSRCFIIGNGPSLSVEDLNILYENNEICFGSNKIYTIFPRTLWRPDYYVCTDKLVYTQNKEEIMNSVTCKMFLNNKFRNIIDRVENEKVIFLNYDTTNSKEKDCSFPRNGLRICTGGSVTFVMIFLAWYMGFKNIYLIGCDHYMSSFEGKTGGTLKYDEEMKLDHFEGYLKENEIVNVGNFDFATKGYACAKEYIKSRQGHLYNATRGGKLEVLDRVDFDDLFVS